VPEQQVVESKPGARTVAIALLVLAVVGILGYQAGSSSRIVTEEVGCLSAEGVIGCTLADGWDVSMTLDISWTDAQGSFHESGRPECLPPTGRGLEGPVRISWTDMDVDGTGWRQVLHVVCLN
jgi:hypothetical protein